MAAFCFGGSDVEGVLGNSCLSLGSRTVSRRQLPQSQAHEHNLEDCPLCHVLAGLSHLLICFPQRSGDAEMPGHCNAATLAQLQARIPDPTVDPIRQTQLPVFSFLAFRV
jgi:hypothetical protein